MKCQYCPARVIWAKTVNNKWLCLDQAEVSYGVRFRLHAQVSAPPLAEKAEYGPGHRAHWDACSGRKRVKSDQKEDAGQMGLFGDEER